MINQVISFKNDDILNRASIVEDINHYIKILERIHPNNTISIGINSKWGSGKSFFMNMWKTELEDSDQKVILYDAWENDDCGSALLPILYNIVSLTTDGEETAFIQYVKNFFKAVLCETSKAGIRKVFGDDSDMSLILEKGISELNANETKTIFRKYDDYYGDRKTLEETLRAIVGNVQGKLWIFIDDLDRCNPDFAINTLECIKHFFNIPNVVYIIGVDMEQLQNIASAVYGLRIDTNSYLKRFFDCIYDMPDPNTEVYIKCKIEKMEIGDSIKELIVPRDIAKFSRHFRCSLRDLNLFLIHLETFLYTNRDLIYECDRPKDALKIYYYFMIIKDKFSIDYDRIIHGDYSVDEKTDSHRKLIDRLFTTADDTVEGLLIAISEGQANKKCTDIFKEYSLFKSDSKTFKKHIQLFLK